MKRLIFFIVSFCLLAISACGQEKSDNDEKIPTVTKETGTIGVVGEFRPQGFLPILIEHRYTPIELRRMIKKACPESINDIFLMLPQENCMNLTVEERRNVLNGERAGSGQFKREFSNNQYMSLTNSSGDVWEMRAIEKDDVWHIAITWQCEYSGYEPYCYSDGILYSCAQWDLSYEQDSWPEQFIDYELLTPEQQEKATAVWQKGVRCLYRLPRQGSIATKFIDRAPYSGIQIPESAFKDSKHQITDRNLIGEEKYYHESGTYCIWGTWGENRVKVAPLNDVDTAYIIEACSFEGAVGDFMVVAHGKEPVRNMYVYRLSTGKLLQIIRDCYGVITPDTDEKGFTVSIVQRKSPQLVWDSPKNTWDPIGKIPSKLYNEELEEMKQLFKDNEYQGLTLSALQMAHVELPTGKVTYRDEYHWKPTDE